jgi:hypothetical protein
MDTVSLVVQKRNFPSRGRVRINEQILETLEISVGESIDLYRTPDEKPVTLTVYADSMVEEGAIRLDEDDMKKLDVEEGASITAIKTPPFGERVKTATSGAAGAVTGGLTDLGKKIAGKTEEVEESVESKLHKEPEEKKEGE